jgi:hypothetical protein
VGGIDAAEAVRRLGATVSEDPDPESNPQMWDYPLTDDAELTVGVTDVPGGCVVTQPWAYAASMPLLGQLLSAGTVCYSLYANPKSGDQGSIIRDGVVEGGDLSTADGWSEPGDPPESILREFLYRFEALAYCCAYAGLGLLDARSITGPPDLWIRLPTRDYWSLA